MPIRTEQGHLLLDVRQHCNAPADGVTDATPAFRAALDKLKAARQASGADTPAILRVPRGRYRFTQIERDAAGSFAGFTNPTLVVSSYTTVDADAEAEFVSEVGPGGDVGHTTCLFVNEAIVRSPTPDALWNGGGDRQIHFRGGLYSVAGLSSAVHIERISGNGSRVHLRRGDADRIEPGMGFQALPRGASAPVVFRVVTKDGASSSLTLDKPLPSLAHSIVRVGWTGGPFVCMINVAGFSMRSMKLADVEGAGFGDECGSTRRAGAGRDARDARDQQTICGATAKDRPAFAPWIAFRAVLSVTDFEIADITSLYRLKRAGNGRAYAHEDGIHFYGPTRRGVIRGLRGETGDDYLAFDANNNLFGIPIPSRHRIIEDIAISDLDVASRWAQAIRIAADSDGGLVRGIRVRQARARGNILGGNGGSGAVFMVGDGRQIPSPQISNIDMSFDRLDCARTGGHCIRIDGGREVRLQAPRIKSRSGMEICVTQSRNISLNGSPVRSGPNGRCGNSMVTAQKLRPRMEGWPD